MWLTVPVSTQTAAVLQGRVFDPSGGTVPAAAVTVTNEAIAFTVTVRTDADGRYSVPAIPPGSYRVTAEASSFRTEVVQQMAIDVGRTLVRDFHLAVGERSETVVVREDAPLVERATATVGHVVTGKTIEEIPLNGRHFLDLGLLVPGSVSPSQAGFSSRPIRGVGALAFNVAGNREEAVGFLVNGVSTNNLTFGSLIFEPPLGSIQEFKADTSGLSPEHGHVSGAIVNIVTRSGSDALHGDVFDFVRDDALDARNFFELTDQPHPFSRQQFGGSLGGPIRRGRTFYFGAYEGFRQRQAVDLNSLVPSDAERAAATDPVIRRLLPLIPRANVVDTNGIARFVGSAPAVVDIDRWTVDVRHRVAANDWIAVFFGGEYVRANEPGSQGNSIPGFGHVFRPSANILTINQTHAFGAGSVNEARFGRSKLNGGTFPAAALNPADYGIADGVTRGIGLPQMIVAGDLNFGGPGTLPQGRHDTSYVLTDTFSRTSGRHALKLGGEYRHFINDNFAEGTGTFNFPTMAAFLAGTANAFTTTLGLRTSVIDQRALGLFAQDRIALRDRLTVELAVRYEWHVTPTDRDDKFVVFDAATASLVRVGVDTDTGIYRQNNRNVEPRIGMVWDLTRDGRSVLRAAYARTVDEPGTTVVRDTAGNPPFGVPLAAAGAIRLDDALETTRPVGLAPATVDPDFHNAALDTWNVTIQRQLARSSAMTVGYLGSRGTHLRISRNINQPTDGVRPFPAVSTASPVLPGAPLGNVTQTESSGVSTYNGGFVAFTKRLAKGLQFDTSYTYAKSLDTNSLNSLGFAVQDAYDIPNQYGLSDYDARHRFVLSGSYQLPFTGHALARGWQIATVVQSQSGNPVNIVTSNSTLNGTPNTVRPDVTGPIRIIGSVDQWFDPSVFVAVNRFGNLGRNVVIGPDFHNVDLSLIKDSPMPGRATLQVRADVFDLFNHPNFGPPGNIVGSPAFGRITRTRLPTGEAGSSRQIQLSVRFVFG